jgi:serine/threonine protein kinase
MSEEIALDAVGQRYQLNGEVGRGGMSVVYAALDPRIGRQVAIKLLHPHLAVREDARKRFLQEAKAIARLENPNILKVYDYDSPDGAASYIVSEFIEGITFKDWYEQHSIKLWEVVALLTIPLFKALAHAHQQGIIHRDVKPENVMIRSRDGSPVLMDFGIAHMVDSETLTATGAVIGSPAHMAPEVVNGERLTEKADLFSMGTVLYWMTCGALPFVAPNPAALFRRILEARFDPINTRRPDVLPSFAHLVESCMERDPQRRPESALSIAESLEDLLALAGIEDIDHTLSELAHHPKQFQQTLPQRLAPAYCQSSKRVLSEGDIYLSLELSQRALILDPNSEDAEKLQRSARKALRSQNSMMISKWSFVGIVILTVLFLGNDLVQSHRSDSGSVDLRANQDLAQLTADQAQKLKAKGVTADHIKDGTSIEDSSNKIDPSKSDKKNSVPSANSSKIIVKNMINKVKSADKLVKSGKLRRRKRRIPKRLRRSAKKPIEPKNKPSRRSIKMVSKEKQRIDISSIYKGVNVFVDGQQVGHIYEIDRAGGLGLTLGDKHEILFTSPFCEAHKEFVTFKKRQTRVPRLVFECKFKPATFKIKANQLAEVFLNGSQPRRLGMTNQQITYQMKATHVNLSLLIMSGNGQGKTLKLRVSAGQYKEVKWP